MDAGTASAAIIASVSVALAVTLIFLGAHETHPAGGIAAFSSEAAILSHFPLTIKALS
jgi:hypothetical protein